MRLLREQVEDAEFLITEAKDGGPKTHKIRGVFMMAETKNRNGRIYPIKTLLREYNRYNDEYIKENRAVGELGHPSNPGINPDKISHKITEMHQDGNNFIGEAQILDTTMGREVKGLMEGGVKFGVSTRGCGSLKECAGYTLVCDDYHLATAADIVMDPSAPMAFVDGVMENAEWLQTADGNWVRQEAIHETKKLIRTIPKARIEQVSMQIFENFISGLKTR
jgi:hypothetical protein